MSMELMSALTREGVLLNVSVRFWRAARKLEAEDLGIESGRIHERLISLGRKRLLSKDALSPLALIESRVHALVDRSTFPFLGGIARFLPNGRLAAVREELGTLQQEFERERDTFIRQYESLREDALLQWREAARSLEVPVDELVARIEEAYPRQSELARHFGFDVHLYQVKAPESLEMEAVTFGDQQEIAQARRKAAEDAAEALGRASGQFVAECVSSLRLEAAHICQEMLASIQTGKTDGVHQKTLNRLLRFIEEFKTLNFAGDGEFERILDEARSTLLSRSAGEYRDNPAALATLQSGLRDLGGVAREMASREAREVVERFGKLGARKFALVA